MFPGVKRAFPPFHLKRTIAGKSFAFCTLWEDGVRAKKNSLPTAFRIRTLERQRAAWSCQRGALRPGARALPARAGVSCSCCRCSCCCCAREPAGLRLRARLRHPPCICGRLVSGTEFSLLLIFASGSILQNCWASGGTPALLESPGVLGS